MDSVDKSAFYIYVFSGNKMARLGVGYLRYVFSRNILNKYGTSSQINNFSSKIFFLAEQPGIAAHIFNKKALQKTWVEFMYYYNIICWGNQC